MAVLRISQSLFYDTTFLEHLQMMSMFLEMELGCRLGEDQIQNHPQYASPMVEFEVYTPLSWELHWNEELSVQLEEVVRGSKVYAIRVYASNGKLLNDIA